MLSDQDASELAGHAQSATNQNHGTINLNRGSSPHTSAKLKTYFEKKGQQDKQFNSLMEANFKGGKAPVKATRLPQVNEGQAESTVGVTTQNLPTSQNQDLRDTKRVDTKLIGAAAESSP